MDSRKTRKRKPSSSPPLKRRIKKIKDIEPEDSSLDEQNHDDSNTFLRSKGFGISAASEKQKKKDLGKDSFITNFFSKGAPAKVPEREHPASKVEVIDESFEKPSTKEIPKAIDWELEEAAANSQLTEELPDEDLINNLNNVNLVVSDKGRNKAGPAITPKPQRKISPAKLPVDRTATARQRVSPRPQKRKASSVSQESAPLASGSKNFFTGKAFVFTGNMNKLSRDDAADEVKALGGFFHFS